MYPPYGGCFCSRFRTFVQWLTNNKRERKQKTKTKELMTKEEQMYREERQLKAIVKCNLLTTDCVTTGTVARRLKMKASELYRKLKERKILYHSDGMWMLMPEYTGLGLLRYRYTLYYTLLGEKKLRVYPVWTKGGVEFVTSTLEQPR